ncbi:MAG: sigma-70 family RNA polymerase sigma factor, partial [Planctomycetota bacterium]
MSAAPLSTSELETMIQEHGAGVYRYLRFLGAERSGEAEDLFQDTFLAALKSMNQPASSEPRVQAAWLRRIARNLFLAHCRRLRTRKVHVDDSFLEKAEAIWSAEFLRADDGSEYLEALRGCLQLLGEKQRQLLNQHYAQGLSRRELAIQYGMTEDG